MIPGINKPIRDHCVEILHVEFGAPEIGAVVLHAHPARIGAEIVQIERSVLMRIHLFRSESTTGGRLTRVESARI